MVTNIRSEESANFLIRKSPRETPAPLELDSMIISDSSLRQPISPISTLSNSPSDQLTSSHNNSEKISFQKFSFSRCSNASSLSSSSISNGHYHDSVGKGITSTPSSNPSQASVPMSVQQNNYLSSNTYRTTNTPNSHSRVLVTCSHQKLCCSICQNNPRAIYIMNNFYTSGVLPVKRKLSTSSTSYSKKISYKSFFESQRNCAINNSYLSRKRFKIN